MSANGVVAVYCNPEGRVVASAADFDPSTFGGFKLIEAQEYRAKQALYRAIIDAYCSRIIYDALNNYDCEQIVRKLPGKIEFVRISNDTVGTKG